MLFDKLLDVCAVVVGVLIGAATLLVVLNVLTRYLLDAVLFGWAIEFTEYVLIYVPFLGMAWLVRRGIGHIQIDILLQGLPSRVRCLIESVAFIVVSLLCVFVSYHGVLTTLDQYTRNVLTSGVFPVPRYLILMVIPVGFALTAVEFLRLSHERLKSARGL